MHRRTVLLTLTAGCLNLFIISCAPDFRLPHREISEPALLPGTDGLDLAPSRQYAGEILSHMLRVVLGDAGAPEERTAWSTRGLNVPLDADAIHSAMNGGHRDKSVYMVFDPNILGLSEVLYHYDRTLNLFKGKRIFDSIYPSVELIALRLLLLQKRHRGEKIRMEALIRREAMLLDESSGATVSDLAATGLNRDEMRLLKQVFAGDPSLFGYLRHPFLLDTLHRDGFIEWDQIVRNARKRVGYRRFRLDCADASVPKQVVRIAILPSLIAEYRCDPSAGKLSRYGFAATPAYRKAAAYLKEKIMERVETLIKGAAGGGKGAADPPGSTPPENRRQGNIRQRILFTLQDQRPLMILPHNAESVAREICPDADFSIIILGKNVYRSIHFDEKKDTYPAANRIYLDFLDVKYAQVSDEIDRVSRFILSKLGADV